MSDDVEVVEPIRYTDEQWEIHCRARRARARLALPGADRAYCEAYARLRLLCEELSQQREEVCRLAAEVARLAHEAGSSLGARIPLSIDFSAPDYNLRRWRIVERQA